MSILSIKLFLFSAINLKIPAIVQRIRHITAQPTGGFHHTRGPLRKQKTISRPGWQKRSTRNHKQAHGFMIHENNIK
jgi:hypothetical protein